MSYDLSVFSADPITIDQFTAALAATDLRAHGTLPCAAISRMVRGEARHTFTVEGPFPIDRSDLPEEVATRMVGITVMYAVMVEGDGRPQVALAKRFARAMAERTAGGVHDRQLDQLIWPRGAVRRFTPPKAERIDSLELQWFIRREDMPPDLPARVLEMVRSWLPEAMPRRFGDYEPLPHQFEETRASGFVREWRGSEELFWSATSPCLGGAMSALGEAVTIPKGKQMPAHPAGQFCLTLDLRALDDARWRHELVDVFPRFAVVSGAFFAQGAVERSWGYSGGSLWADGTTKTLPSRITRERAWRALLPHPVWLAWYGELYRPLIEPFTDDRWAEVAGGLFRRDGEHPNDAEPVKWHTGLRIPEALR